MELNANIESRLVAWSNSTFTYIYILHYITYSWAKSLREYYYDASTKFFMEM